MTPGTTAGAQRFGRAQSHDLVDGHHLVAFESRRNRVLTRGAHDVDLVDRQLLLTNHERVLIVVGERRDIDTFDRVERSLDLRTR